MVWIFRNYLNTMLQKPIFANWEKIYSAPDANDKYADWPIYARNKTSDNLLSQGDFFHEMAFHWERNRAYYTKVFRDSSYIDFFDYIIALYLPLFREDILIMLNGKEIPGIVLDFLAEYHAMGVFGRLRYHFARTGKFIMQEELDPFWNYAHITTWYTLDKCFSEQPFSKLEQFLGKKGARKIYTGIRIEH